ncbi:MAG: DUF58 domain-containing protein, partial [Bacteroidales bacterium]|nr:DUF58 domain-containing protein [Candidatus Colimorpha onthohippi]
LFVKQYEEETNLRCQLVIDQSGSMLFPIEGTGNLRHPNKLTFAVYASALLVELLSKGRDAFGLTLLSDGVDFSSQVRSSGTHKHYVLQKLQAALDAAATVKPGQHRGTTNIAESLHQIAEQMHRRSLIVIFTDAFVDEQQTAQLIDALRHLRHNRHEVLLFHTYDAAKELALDYGNQPTEFIDLETGIRLRLQPDQLAQSYQKEMERRTSYIKQRAIQYRVDYQPVDVSLGFEPVMLPFLIKRARCN